MALYNTPLRYPGGKQKLSPFIFEILQYNNLIGIEYVEPYAGGAGVAIELLLNNMVSSIVLNDSCDFIYSFWKTLITKPEWLCNKVLLSSLTIEEWLKQREVLRHKNDYSMEDIGFATLYLNRCNHSGILSGGVIGGLKQTGNWKMDARFSRQDIIRRIEAISKKSNKIKVYKQDAGIFLQKYSTSRNKQSFLYCDPPYLNKAEKLYQNYYNHDDHRHVADVIQQIKNNYWIVSYDYSDYISSLYQDRTKFIYGLQYNARKAYLGSELFIFSDELKIPKSSKVKQIDIVLKTLTA